MLSGIVAILGAVAGFMPALIQLFQQKEKNAHDLAMAELQIEAAKTGGALQIDLANAQADIKQADRIYDFASGPSGNRFVDALAIFVRPYITLVFFHLWMMMEIGLFVYGVNHGFDLGQVVKLLWDDNTAAIFGAIMGFWFGDRMIMRRDQKMAATLAVSPTTSFKKGN